MKPSPTRPRFQAARLAVPGVWVMAVLTAIAVPAVAHDRAPWHLPEWKSRQVVRVAQPEAVGKVNVARAEFAARPPVLAADGRDLRVLDEHGNSLKYHWIRPDGEPVDAPFGPDASGAVHIRIVEPAVRTLYLYYGNPAAEPAASRWEKNVESLTLETRVNPNPRAPASWAEMTALLAANSWNFGEGPRPRVDDSENPFGANESYISIYKGKLHCPLDGQYGFATDSSDASFLLVDGRLVAQWEGNHGPADRFDHFGTIYLSAGTYKFEYYHVQSQGTPRARAGWQPPGTTDFQMIPEYAFLREIRTETEAVEHRDNPLGVLFGASVRQALRFGEGGPTFTTVRFEDRSVSSLADVVAWEWDFGDGTVSREPNPVHAFNGLDKAMVRLRCVDALGYENEWRQEIALAGEGATVFTPELQVQPVDSLLMEGERLRLEVKCRCVADRPLAFDLLMTAGADENMVVWRATEPLILDTSEWVARTLDFGREQAPLTAVKTATVSLQFQGHRALSRTVCVRSAADPTLQASASETGLLDGAGRTVVLRVGDSRASRPRVTLKEALSESGSVRVTIVDDGLALDNDAGYIARLREMLKKRYPAVDVQVARMRPASKRGLGASFEDLADLPKRVQEERPHVVLIVGSPRDVLSATAPELLEKRVQALVDRLLAATETQVVLVRPPPLVANPRLSQEHGEAMRRVGRRSGLRVVDLYDAFVAEGRAQPGRAGPESGWRVLFRDENAGGPLYHVAPVAAGQQVIAETLMSELLRE